MSAGLLIVVLLAYAALGLLFHAYALSVLWGWFIVPLGAPVLELVPALGVQLVVNALMQRQPPKADPENPELLEKAIAAVAVPAAFLAFGWLVKGFL